MNRASSEVLDKIATAPRLGDVDFEWTPVWHESADRRLGFFVGRSAVPERWSDVILQGPHVTVATPLNQQPNETMRSNQDYAHIDLNAITGEFIPRTNYQVAMPFGKYSAAYPQWCGKSSAAFFRLAWREMCDPATVRTLHAALLAPEPAHVGGLLSLMTSEAVNLALMAGFTGSLLADFLVKVMSVGHVKTSTLGKIPHIRDHVTVAHGRRSTTAQEHCGGHPIPNGSGSSTTGTTWNCPTPYRCSRAPSSCCAPTPTRSP